MKDEKGGEAYRKKLKTDCEMCGKGISEEDLEVCLLGNNIVALFLGKVSAGADGGPCSQVCAC